LQLQKLASYSEAFKEILFVNDKDGNVLFLDPNITPDSILLKLQY